jgi:pimeloyl-ACP methyl ester carboxylesterase
MTSLLCMLGIIAAGFGAEMDRSQLLEELLAMTPDAPVFSEWLRETGELPPDFDAIPSYAPLPLPLSPFINGEVKHIDSTAGWEDERQRLIGELQHWILGSVPPTPDNLKATVLNEKEEAGARVREVELRFGPEHKAKLWLQLYMPKGNGPFPVFMTQDNHLGWAQIALRRGYIACVYAGADSRDDTDTFVEAWPGYDWSRLMRRGWAASRCIDYLETVQEANTAQVALTGHSRNGKTSLMGAALDPRIAVVISSSSGVGGAMASRYCGEHHFSEGIEHITRNFPDWFHPRWRFFCGREHKVPVDLHHLTALAAPRPCLLSIALNDTVEHTQAGQHTYLAAKPVYELYDAADRLRILWRSGSHETCAAIIERYVDWCDVQFGRGDFSFPETFVFPWDWEGWRQKAAIPFAPEQLPERPFGAGDTTDLAARVNMILGETPPVATVPNMTYGRARTDVQIQMGRATAGGGLDRDEIVFGDYINGDVYAPLGTIKKETPLPAILYLPPLCAPTGYSAAYRRGEQAYQTLARAGFAVFCYDPIGTGRRVEEAGLFYERHPDWSLLGKMIYDAQAALDAMSELPYIDPDRIWVVGYEMGALVAMHLAALDNRPDGYGLVCPPLPYRLDTDVYETGGVQRWAQEMMLVPRLGLFAGLETHIPYELDEALAGVAPKPLVLITPTHDRFAPADKMNAFEDSLQSRYDSLNAGDNLVRVSPAKYNHFDNTMQAVLIEALLPMLEKQSKL